MKKTLLAATIFSASAFMASSASAQMMAPGAELLGQTVSIAYADGTTNTVLFQDGGGAVIRANNGATANARWYVQNSQICLQNSTDSECWPYARQFAANETLALRSDCNVTSNWTPLSVARPAVVPAARPAPMPMPMPVPDRSGERG